VFVNVKLALESAGAMPKDVIKLRYYVANFNTDLLPHLRSAVSEFYGGDYRATSTLIPVPTLFDPRALLEVEATAAI
jgi:enamine deaminase RidA (YjgF/YER057c/UK114 family)